MSQAGHLAPPFSTTLSNWMTDMYKSYVTRAIEDAFRLLAAGRNNFAGGTGYYEPESKKYAVLFPNQSEPTWYDSFDEAMYAVYNYMTTVEES